MNCSKLRRGGRIATAGLLIGCLASPFVGASAAGKPVTHPAKHSVRSKPKPKHHLSAPAVPLIPKKVNPFAQLVTYINGQLMQISRPYSRLFIIGQDELTKPAPVGNTVYAVIATDKPRILSRKTVDGVIDNVAVDDTRGIAYLAVRTQPFVAAVPASASSHEELWSVNLKSGQVIAHQLFYEGEAETISVMTIDPTTGHVFVASTRAGSGTYDLTMIDATTMNTNVQSLLGPVDHIYINTRMHRLAVSTSVPQGASTISRFDGYDTRDLSYLWTHRFTYLATAYTSFATFYDNHSQQAWVLAPGGLVTLVDVASGHITSQIQMTFQHPDAWNLNGFAVNTKTEQGYATWNGPWPEHKGSICHVDSINPRSHAHAPYFDYSFGIPATDSYPCGAVGATLTAVDESSNHLVLGDSYAIHIYDLHTGRLIKLYSLLTPLGAPASWTSYILIQHSDHITTVFATEIPYQNQGTGAITAGALKFINF